MCSGAYEDFLKSGKMQVTREHVHKRKEHKSFFFFFFLCSFKYRNTFIYIFLSTISTNVLKEDISLFHVMVSYLQY